MSDKTRELRSLYRRLQDIVCSISGEESEHLDEPTLMIAGSVCLLGRILEREDKAMFSELILVLSDFAHRE